MFNLNRQRPMGTSMSEYGKSVIESVIMCILQVREFILSPIKNPKLELVLVMFIVPFIVNVSMKIAF